jgi:hypothetical protein
MHFNTMTLMLVSALATGLMATPIQEQDAVSDWVEHSREIGKTGGHLIYFGPRNGTETPESQEEGNTLQPRSCGYSSKEPKCDGSHGARNANCEALVSELYDDSDVSIPKSPRQICYQGDSGKNTFCCVSWHNAITGLKKKDLAPYADKSESMWLPFPS